MNEIIEENMLPRLLLSRAEAKEKIQDRIDKGQQLHDRQIDSKEEFEKAEANFGI